MPRRARLHVVGGTFHIVSRFVHQEPWLDRPGAREAYLTFLERAAATGGVKVLAYCLMSTHVHVVVVQGERSLERFCKSMHTSFSTWVHQHARGKKAHGPVFAQRPLSVLVDDQQYLLELVRYVHNHPVRAGLVKHARNSDWSSHNAYVGRKAAPGFLHTAPVLKQFGKSAAVASKRFEAFVDAGRDELRRPEFGGAESAGEAAAVRGRLPQGHALQHGVLGRASFVRKTLEAASNAKQATSSSTRAPRNTEAKTRLPRTRRPSVEKLLDAVLRHKKVSALSFDARPKARSSGEVKRLVVWIWMQVYEGKQSELSRGLGLASSMVSRYYGQVLAAAGEYDRDTKAIVARLGHSSRR